jgi:hypothetical protein
VPIVLKARNDAATTIIIIMGSLFIFNRYLSVPDIEPKITQKACFSCLYRDLTMVFDEWRSPVEGIYTI